MFETLTWWVMLEIIGLAATPIMFLLARRLPGRGYALGKILGILLLGYIVWLTGILHLMAFSWGSTFVALLLIAAVSLWLLRRDEGSLLAEWRDFFHAQRTFIIVTEVVFALAFFAWAFYRAHDPQVINTEKYMDFGIVNAILNSDYFPPHDQWLSGFNINYYYFGYLITAALTKLSGVTPNITFNLANALYFALGVLGSFGILWELVALRRRAAGQLAAAGRQSLAPYIVGGIGALLIMCGGNLYTAQVLWNAQFNPQGAGVAQAWDKIWNQQMYGNVGWDSSRIVHDSLNGVPSTVDTINEFPAFSYMLADLHPHVMALPLTMLALFLALILLVSGYGAKSILSGDIHARSTLVVLVITIGGLFMANTWDFPTYLLIAVLAMLVNSRRLAKGALRLVVAAAPPLAPPVTGEGIVAPPVTGGGMMAASPTGGGVLAAPLAPVAPAIATRPVATSKGMVTDAPSEDVGLASIPDQEIDAPAISDEEKPQVVEDDGGADLEAEEESAPTLWERLNANSWVSWLIQSATVAILSLLLYLPYLLTYKAPFGSGLPSAVTNDPTLGGIVKLPIISTILNYIAPNVWDKSWSGFAIIFGISLYATVIFLIAQAWKAYRVNAVKVGAYVVVGVVVVSLLLAVLLKFPLLVLLPPMIALAVYALVRLPRLSDADTMVTLIIGLGAVIALGTEMFFLRDVFDNRQNTLFKFYFQLWLIWNLAAVYAVWWGLSRALGWLRERRDEVRIPAISAAAFVWTVGFALLLFASALYLPAAMREKGIFYGSVNPSGPVNRPLTLDGWYDFGQGNASDLAAMNWLRANAAPDATIVEGAPEVEYQMGVDGGRVSSYTGRPAVLAWRGHEYQWHNGDSKILDTLPGRTTDVQTLFTGSADQTRQTVDKYQIDYIFVGKIEKDAMKAIPNADQKFTQLGYLPVYDTGGTTIYQTPYALGPTGPHVDQVVAGH